jgi:isopentenyl-diphosphate Delta-isomerase
MSDEIQARKGDHLRLAAEADVASRRGTGLDDVHLVHNAAPELDFGRIDPSIEFLGRRLELPLVIASMTGGHPDGARVNATLARAAERHGIAMGVGSQRAALADARLADSYAIARREAPTALLIANVGVPQLVLQQRGTPIEPSELRQLVAMIRADALVIHLNPLQELVQSEGDRNAVGYLDAIARVVSAVDVPVIAKETGAGVSRTVARRLAAVGVSAIDVGGVGGTSFAAVEAMRAEARGDQRGARLGSLLRDWGIPTAVSIVLAADTRLPVIGTGGIRSGLDAAKAVALGAIAVGVARPVLRRALEGGDEAVSSWVEDFGEEFRAAQFLVGAGTTQELRAAPRVVLGETAEWLRQLLPETSEWLPGE